MIYRVSQNSTDKIGGFAEGTQTKILKFGTYGLLGVFTELRCFFLMCFEKIYLMILRIKTGALIGNSN